MKKVLDFSFVQDTGFQNKTKKRSISFFTVAGRILLIVPVSYIILFPLFLMVSTSLQTRQQLLDPSVVWIPKSIMLDNFKAALEILDYGKSFLISLRLNILSALIEVFTCAVTAYGFARFKFRFKNIFLIILIISIIVPPEMIVIPTYMQLRHYDAFGLLKIIGGLLHTELRPNLIDSEWSFWIPSIFSVGLRSGLFIFIYMQFFKNLPKELEEAAYIDGAGPLKTYLRIVLPSSGIAILTVSIFSIIWHWNETYLSTVYFTSNFSLAVQVSQIYMRMAFLGTNQVYSVTNGIVMAGCLLFILPMLLMYMFLQKYFIQSIDRVGIVG